MRLQLPDDFKKRRAESKFVDPYTRASNPGDFKVHWGQYFRAFPDPGMTPSLKLTLALSGGLSVESLSRFAFQAASEKMQLKMRQVQDHFAFGNTLPGLIVSQNPPQIAVLTDLTFGLGQFNTLKVLGQPLAACGLGHAIVGTRVAAVALYYDTGHKRHWGDFRPIVLDAATRDPEAIRRAMASFSEGDWLELEAALATLPSPPPPGLHPIGWTLEHS